MPDYSCRKTLSMYDKVKIWLLKTKTTPDIVSLLDNATEQINHGTGDVCVFGSLDGLKVSIYTGWINIVGSLPKFLNGNNINDFGRKNTKEAIEKLSDRLGCNVSSGKITGLEFGRVFSMSQPIENYLSRLGEMPNLLRYRFEAGTLYYKPRGKQQTKVFIFYDKRAEAKEKGFKLPVGFEDMNLLRYEMRLNGRLPQQLGVTEVKASTLSEIKFYISLVKRYQESYFAISRNNRINIRAMEEIKTVSDALDMFVARLINKSGKGEITAFLDELRGLNVFDDRKYYYRLKKRLQEIAEKAGDPEPDQLLQELDDEINNTGAYI